MAYLWLKAAHVIVVIAWMAGMLYLPRIFVYHASVSGTGSEPSQTFKVMERRLLRFIMTPAMIAVWITGLWLAWWSGFYRSGWLHAKVALVLILSALHGFLSQRVRKFSEDSDGHTPAFYRIVNEIPTVLMIAIVLLVVLKPF